MSPRELQRYRQVMHHRVVVHKNDGSSVEGYLQPWSETTLYLTPLGDAQGEAIRVAIADISTIEVNDQ